MAFGSDGVGWRLGRLLGQGGSPVVIVAMDHGLAGVPEGFSLAETTIRQVLDGEPQGILLNAGMARRFLPLLASRDAPSLVVALDFVLHAGPSASGPAVGHCSAVPVEDAIRLGADAVKTMLILGGSDRHIQLRNMQCIAEAATACRHWEMPLMIEPYLWGENAPTDPTDRAKLAADGVRIAAELGADLVKVEYSGDVVAFSEVVASSPVPVTVLGGAKRGTIREMLEEVVAVANAGAAGLSMGRNVWQRPDPARMIRSLDVALRTRDVEAAIAELKLDHGNDHFESH